MDDTSRTRYIQTQGNAYYMGGTHAVNADGDMYAGDIEIQVRFRSERVSGVVSNLVSMDDGEAWTYQFGEVDSIILPDADLNDKATWDMTDVAEVTFATRAGSPGAQRIPGTFEGVLSGTGDDAGMYASGTWSTGDRVDMKSAYLAGGFGAERVEDSPVSRPDLDDGSGAGAKVVPASGTAIADGMLKLTFEHDNPNTDDKATEEINLATLLDLDGGNRNENGAKWVDVARAAIEDIRSDLAALQNLETRLRDQEADKWMAFQDELSSLFGLAKGHDDFPQRLNGVYDDDEALGLIDRTLAGLASSSALADARAEGGIFEDFVSDDDDVTTDVGHFWGRRQWQVQAHMGSTDYTRFGVWRLRTTDSAADGWTNQHSGNNDNGPNSFAYSPLGQTVYTSHEDPTYPGGGSATYMGGVMARQQATVFAGDAEASVSWRADTVGGMLNVVLSNLANAGNGDLLVLQRHDVSNSENTVDLGALPLREIVLSGIAVGTDLAFNDMIGSEDTQAQVRISFQDRSMGEMDVTGHSSGMVAGNFVGKDIDGPLGVIGRFELKKVDTTTGTTRKRIGDGTTIFGAFGAEVMP